MRDTRHQPSQGGHLFRLHQLVLGLGEGGDGLLQFDIGPLERLLGALAFGEVDAGGDDVLDTTALAQQYGVGPGDGAQFATARAPFGLVAGWLRGVDQTAEVVARRVHLVGRQQFVPEEGVAQFVEGVAAQVLAGLVEAHDVPTAVQ